MREWSVLLTAGGDLPARRAVYHLALKSPEYMVHGVFLA
jgi:hypothetical protein